MFVRKNPRNFLTPTEEQLELNEEKKIDSTEEKSAGEETYTPVDNRGIEIPSKRGPVSSDIFNPILL